MATIFNKDFPNLQDVTQKKTSEETDTYNCIAWAFNDSRRHWWPNLRNSFWPMAASPKQSTMVAFEAWFEKDGWELIVTDKVEEGYKKIALYVRLGKPTHAARQLPNSKWTSKLGLSIDLSHDLQDLEGPFYGTVEKIYRKHSSA